VTEDLLVDEISKYSLRSNP